VTRGGGAAALHHLDLSGLVLSYGAVQHVVHQLRVLSYFFHLVLNEYNGDEKKKREKTKMGWESTTSVIKSLMR
jgi:hypothetical protein